MNHSLSSPWTELPSDPFAPLAPRARAGSMSRIQLTSAQAFVACEVCCDPGPDDFPIPDEPSEASPYGVLASLEE